MIRTRFNRILGRHVGNESGMTLAEIAIALGLLIAIFAMWIGPSMQLWRWVKENETDRRLKDIRQAMAVIYKQNAWNIDNSNTATLVTVIQGTTYTLAAGRGNDAGNFAAMNAYASVANLPNAGIERDAMHAPYYVYVSNRLSDASSGASYHVVSMVSPGWNGIMESSFDAATGVLTLGGDDQGFIFSGLQTQISIMDDAQQKLNLVRDAWQANFTSLFLADATKNIYVYRFAAQSSACAGSQWYGGGAAVTNSACVVNPTLTNTGLAGAIGVGALTTGWNRELLIDTHSGSTRNPGTVGQAPPYTARVLAELPWGGNLTATASGLY